MLTYISFLPPSTQCKYFKENSTVLIVCVIAVRDTFIHNKTYSVFLGRINVTSES